MARLTQRKCFAIAFVLNLLVLLKIWSSVQSRDDGAETRALKDRPLQDVDRRFVDRAWPLPDWPKYAPERLSKSQRRDRIAWIWAAVRLELFRVGVGVLCHVVGLLSARG